MPHYRLQFRKKKRKITVDVDTVPGKKGREILDEKSLEELAKKTLPKHVRPAEARLFWMGKPNFYGDNIADMRIAIPKDQAKDEDLPPFRIYGITDHYLFVAWPLILEHDRPPVAEAEDFEDEEEEFEEEP